MQEKSLGFSLTMTPHFSLPAFTSNLSFCTQSHQDLLKLATLQKDLTERNGCQPTFAQWAAAAGTDPKALRKRINHGIFCKDKMIKSNIRLVISIAKNYQGAGMNIQDLVQVRSYLSASNL